MSPCSPIRCLILACGNSLRGDDGVGPWLGAWAVERFRDDPEIRVIASQQWGPELAEEIARSETVLFVDSSLQATPGRVELAPVRPAMREASLPAHHLDAAGLLAISREFCGALPRRANLLTVGVESIGLGEGLSDAIRAAMPEACRKMEEAVLARDAFQPEDRRD